MHVTPPCRLQHAPPPLWMGSWFKVAARTLPMAPVPSLVLALHTLALMAAEDESSKRR